MLPREEDDDDEAERTTTRDETFTPKFTLLRPRQTGNERTPMPTTHGELDEEAVPTAAICLLGAAIVPATPASTTIAIATPKPSIPASVSRSPSYPLLELEKKNHNPDWNSGKPHNQCVDLNRNRRPWDRGEEQRNSSLPPSPWLWRALCGSGIYPPTRSLTVDLLDRTVDRPPVQWRGECG